MFAAVNSAKDKDPEPVSFFMPHQDRWMVETNQRKVTISRKAAQEFLKTYKDFPAGVEAAFDEWLYDIKLCAKGL